MPEKKRGPRSARPTRSVPQRKSQLGHHKNMAPPITSSVHDDEDDISAAGARTKPPRAKPGSDGQQSPQVLLEQAYDLILEAFGQMGYDIGDDNFRDTGPRAAQGLLEMVFPIDTINAGVEELVGKSFSARYDEMVISKANVCFGLCPHHLLPVIYRISIAYLPSKKVLGISKLSRLAKLLSRRPVLQEELTQDLAEVLHTRLQSRGSAAYVEGLHLCMAARGSESHEARVVTSAVRGIFREQPTTRAEFLKLVTTAQTPLL